MIQHYLKVLDRSHKVFAKQARLTIIATTIPIVLLIMMMMARGIITPKMVQIVDGDDTGLRSHSLILRRRTEQ